MAKLYNEFDYTDAQWKNTDFMLLELSSLKSKGINLDVPVIDNRRFVSFADYLKQKANPELYVELMKKGLIENICKFEIQSGVVTEGKHGLVWMGENFKEYQDVIINAIGDLATHLDKNTVKKIKIKDFKGQIQSYDNEPVLFTIVSKLLVGSSKPFAGRKSHNAKVWDTILSSNSDIKAYMNNKLLSHKQVESFFSIPRFSAYLGEPGLAGVFYKHNLARNYFHTNTHKVCSLLYDLIEKNELKSVKDLMPVYLNSDKFDIYPSHAMLKSARSPEMARMLLDYGCPFMIEDNTWQQKPIYTFALEKEMNSETLKAIINFKPSHIENMDKYPQAIHDNFFKNSSDFSLMKTFVESGFKIDKYDMLDIGYKLDKKDLQYSKWFLDNGANPAYCESFVTTLSTHPSEMKVLNQYKNSIDIYSGDFIYQMLTKGGFKDYKDTLSLEMLEHPTAQGVPAWWGGRLNTSLITRYINQPGPKTIETNNDSWLAHMYESGQFESAISWATQYKNNLTSSEKYPLKFNSDQNILHHIFIPFMDRDINLHSSVFKFILEQTSINLKLELVQKDNMGITPLNMLLCSEDYDADRPYLFRSTTRYQITKKLIKELDKDFPFEEIIKDKSAADIVKSWASSDDEFEVEPFYRAYLSNKLDNLLDKKDIVIKKIKI